MFGVVSTRMFFLKTPHKKTGFCALVTLTGSTNQQTQEDQKLITKQQQKNLLACEFS